MKSNQHCVSPSQNIITMGNEVMNDFSKGKSVYFFAGAGLVSLINFLGQILVFFLGGVSDFAMRGFLIPLTVLLTLGILFLTFTALLKRNLIFGLGMITLVVLNIIIYSPFLFAPK